MDTRERSLNRIVIGLVIGILVGAVAGYVVVMPQITSLQILANTLQPQVTLYKSEADKVPGLQQQITALSGDKTTLQSQITGLQSQITLLKNNNTNLQTQISNLQKQIDSLSPSYPKGTWNVLKIISGNDAITTDYFYVPQTELRVKWVYTHLQDPWINLYLFKQGATKYTWYDNSMTQSTGLTYIHNVEKGNYYLDILQNTDIINWTITIEMYVPV
jgi:FtsZ-binding cell division protein ZapB